MSPELLTILMLVGIFVGVFLGFPIGFTLGGLALIFGSFGWEGTGVFYLFASRAYGIMTQYIYAAIPLFIFMGAMLETAGVAEMAYNSLYKLFGKLNGGLALATIVICAMFAACTGVVGAAIATMGVIALPSMLNRNYSKSLATGIIGAGGSLGILIPPSIMLILFGPMSGVSVVQLFAAAIAPGLMLAVFYFIYVLVLCKLRPEMGPAIPADQREKLQLFKLLINLLPFVFLIVLVMGAIFTGFAAPTEGAGIGAFGSIIVAAIYRKLTWRALYGACFATLRITSMILFVALGATLFTSVFFSIGGGRVLTDFVMGLGLSGYGMLAVILFIVFLFGMFIDWLGILLIMAPIFVPILALYGFDPLWSGMLIMVALQPSFLTPPFAVALFYIKGVAPESVALSDIYKGVIPFVLIQIFALILCILFPSIITWIPLFMAG